MESQNPEFRGCKKNIATSYTPCWIDLPTEITANILHRLGAIYILANAQKVCTTWRSVCLDPSMWRVIDMRIDETMHHVHYNLDKMCRHAVDRSQGELIDINIESFGNSPLLNYIAERSRHLKRLSFAPWSSDNRCAYKYGNEEYEGGDLSRAISKLPELEELHVIIIHDEIEAQDVETIGISCPMLKSFTINGIWYATLSDHFFHDSQGEPDEVAIAIAKNMPNLRRLGLIGSKMYNEELQAILDGCPHLESLDLRGCQNLALGSDLRERCSKLIKCLKRRHSNSTSYYCWPATNPWLIGDDNM